MGGYEQKSGMTTAEELGCLRRPLIVLVPFPAQGHVTPILHLAATLRRHGFCPVVALPESIHRRLPHADKTRPLLDGEDGTEIAFEVVPDGLAEGAPGGFFEIERAMEEVMPAHFEGLLRRLIGGGGGLGGVACVVVDLLASWAMAVAARLSIPVAGFWPAMLATYRLISTAPDMVRRGLISASGIPLGDGTVSAALPGCRPSLTTADLPWLVGDVPSQIGRFSFWRRTLDRSRHLRWLLFNTFSGEGCHILHEPLHKDHGNLCFPSPVPRILHVGPLTSSGTGGGGGSGLISFWEEDESCMQWLDTQPRGSVVYVSFGSWVGPVGADSLAELAAGLEATRRPFLWVLGDSWRKGLPEGWLERVAGHGKVVKWAPQREMLRHGAVGCFLTHCGWNSIVEAVECRKRLLCHPVSGDQFVNCKYVVELWGVGVRLEGMRRREVEAGVGRVMGVEGEELQRRVDAMSEGIYGEVGRARAAAELSAFVEEVKGGTAAADEWSLLHVSTLHGSWVQSLVVKA